MIVLLDGEVIAASDSCEAVSHADTALSSSPQGTYLVGMRDELEITASHFVTSIGGSIAGQRVYVTFRDKDGKQVSANAICTEVKITGTVGKLAKGSLKLRCTGIIHTEDSPRRYFTLNISRLNGKHVLR